MVSTTTGGQPAYYIPQPSHWPIVGSVALLLMGSGAAMWFNDVGIGMEPETMVTMTGPQAATGSIVTLYSDSGILEGSSILTWQGGSPTEKEKLSPKEAHLLKMFCQHKNDVLTRAEALAKIWGEDNYFTARSMDVFVTKLRKYLSKDPNLQILNIHGNGFRLIEKDQVED